MLILDCTELVLLLQYFYYSEVLNCSSCTCNEVFLDVGGLPEFEYLFHQWPMGWRKAPSRFVSAESQWVWNRDHVVSWQHLGCYFKQSFQRDIQDCKHSDLNRHTASVSYTRVRWHTEDTHFPLSLSLTHTCDLYLADTNMQTLVRQNDTDAHMPGWRLASTLSKVHWVYHSLSRFSLFLL